MQFELSNDERNKNVHVIIYENVHILKFQNSKPELYLSEVCPGTLPNWDSIELDCYSN